MGNTAFRHIAVAILIWCLIPGCEMDGDSNDSGAINFWFDSAGEAGTMSITSPPPVFSADGSFTVTGNIKNNYLNYSYAIVWKDSEPKDEYLYLIQGDPVTGAFTQDIHLRYGDGAYTVIFIRVTEAKIALNGKGAVHSMGGIYYSSDTYHVTNTKTGTADAWTLLPSYEIPITQEIRWLRDKILSDAGVAGGNDEQKIRAINKWIVLNLSYDYDSLIDGRRKKQDSLSVLQNKLALCEGYANLTASLARSAGIQTRYVSSEPMNHAWVQVYIGSAWKMLDTTWNDPRFNGYPENFPNNISSGNWDSYKDFTEAYFLLSGINGKEDHTGGEWTNSRAVSGLPDGVDYGYSFIKRRYND
jgi:transglutaminase-like putative cysteine protease